MYFSKINTNMILSNHTRKYCFIFTCCYTLKQRPLSSGKTNLSKQKSALPSTKEEDEFLFYEFSNLYINVDLSIPPSNCSVVSFRSKDFLTIFNSPKSEPTKSADGGGALKMKT